MRYTAAVATTGAAESVAEDKGPDAHAQFLACDTFCDWGKINLNVTEHGQHAKLAVQSVTDDDLLLGFGLHQMQQLGLQCLNGLPQLGQLAVFGSCCQSQAPLLTLVHGHLQQARSSHSSASRLSANQATVLKRLACLS